MIYYGNHPVPWYKIKELCYYNLIQSLYHGTASALSEGGGGEDLVTYDSYSPHIPPTPYTHIWHRCFVGVCVCVSVSVLIKSIERRKDSRWLVTVARADQLPGVTAKRLVTHRRRLLLLLTVMSPMYSSHTCFPHLSLSSLCLWTVFIHNLCIFANLISPEFRLRISNRHVNCCHDSIDQRFLTFFWFYETPQPHK